MKPIKLIIILIMVLILLTACQSPTAAPAPTLTAVSTAALQTPAPTQPPVPSASPSLVQPTPASADLRTLAAHALFTLYTKPNRMDVSTISGDKTTTNTIEFIPPDRKRISGGQVEFIVIGGKVYDTTAGSWAESKLPASSLLGDPNITESGIADTITNPSFLRKDSLDGKSILVLHFNSIDHFNGMDLPRQTELWVGEADGLPYKMVVDGEVASVSSDPDTGQSSLGAVKSISTTLITFDSAIQITSPLN